MYVYCCRDRKKINNVPEYSGQPCNILPVSFICSERFSAYQNTAALFGKQQDVTTSSVSTTPSELGNSNTLQHPERKKPVPLPRSKIPVSQSESLSQSQTQSKSQSQSQTHSQTQTQSKSQTSNSSAQQPKKQPSEGGGPPPKISLHARFFSKRAKTDLGFDGLAAYKANKKPPGGTKYPAPKVPTFNRPVPQQRQQQPPSSLSGRGQKEMSQLSQSQVSQSQPRFKLPQKQPKEANKTTKKPEAKIKPEIKEKPLFSTFKQREQNDSFRFVKVTAGFGESSFPRLRDPACWLPLAAGASSRNL